MAKFIWLERIFLLRVADTVLGGEVAGFLNSGGKSRLADLTIQIIILFAVVLRKINACFAKLIDHP